MPHLLSLAACLATVALASGDPLQLWTAYTGWPTCYRQPLLVRTRTALLAFVEGRPGILPCSGTSYPAAPDFPILVRTSTDGGASFGAPVNITRGNLDFLVSVYDEHSDSVHLLLQLGDDGVLATRSGDDGRSWSAPVAVNISAPGLASLIPGVGHGLQISPRLCDEPTCGGTAGRLVLPFVATLSGPVSNDTACGSCATAIVYSDDGGRRWALGAVSEQNGSREAALVQLDSRAAGARGGAVIYAAERNLGNQTGHRLHALSLNGGGSFARYGSDSLPDVVTSNWTGVVAGCTRFDGGARPALFFSAPAAPQERADLSLWRSDDEGLSWSAAPIATLWPGPAAYSDLVQLNDTHIAAVWEGGHDEFAQGILFQTIDVRAL